MCDRSEMDRPEVTISKREIEAKTGLCKKTIKKALQHLRALGVILPLKGFEGGSGVATTYRLCDLGQGDAKQPEVDGKGRKCPPKLFSEWHKHLGITAAMQRKERYEAEKGESHKN